MYAILFFLFSIKSESMKYIIKLHRCELSSPNSGMQTSNYLTLSLRMDIITVHAALL